MQANATTPLVWSWWLVAENTDQPGPVSLAGRHVARGATATRAEAETQAKAASADRRPEDTRLGRLPGDTEDTQASSFVLLLERRDRTFRRVLETHRTPLV